MASHDIGHEGRSDSVGPLAETPAEQLGRGRGSRDWLRRVDDQVVRGDAPCRVVLPPFEFDEGRVPGSITRGVVACRPRSDGAGHRDALDIIAEICSGDLGVVGLGKPLTRAIRVVNDRYQSRTDGWDDDSKDRDGNQKLHQRESRLVALELQGHGYTPAPRVPAHRLTTPTDSLPLSDVTCSVICCRPVSTGPGAQAEANWGEGRSVRQNCTLVAPAV